MPVRRFHIVIRLLGLPCQSLCVSGFFSAVPDGGTALAQGEACIAVSQPAFINANN